MAGEIVTTHFSGLSMTSPARDPRSRPVPPALTASNISHQNAGDQVASYAHYLMRPILQLGPLLFAAAVTSTIAFAFIERDEGHLSADKGLGYWLGIAGAVIMLTLIGYPLRKRLRSLRTAGRVANWFRLHMILGIIGPAFVILHTNFKLGSLNSRLALFTMLVVVASGIIGRYLYAKVHKGLYGKQAQLRDVLGDVASLRQGLGAEFAALTGIESELGRYVPKENAAPSSLWTGLFSALTAGQRTRFSRRRILRHARLKLASQQLPGRQRRAFIKDVDGQLKVYFAAVKKADRLAFFERLFGMWHHLHVPLFILLILTVTLHVIAVHRY